MLVRIKKMHRVGLFESAGLPSVALGQCTLVFAPNGHGKSTVASVFRSLSANDPTIVEERRTIDSEGAPNVHLLFGSGDVKFEAGQWVGVRPAALVYDNHFIETNVYSGEHVTTDHRRNLLEFALGASAVAAKEAEAEATRRVKEHRTAIRDLELQLAKYQGAQSSRDFRSLTENPQIDDVIASLDRDLETARRAHAVLSRPLPAEAQVPRFDLDDVVDVLNEDLSHVHEQAGQAVQNHIAGLGMPEVSEWLRTGHLLEKDGHCPYCSQPLDGVELVQMYRSYFDKAFEALVKSIRDSILTVESSFADSVVDTFRHEAGVAGERADTWREDIDLPVLDDPAFDVMTDLIRATREEVVRLLRKKQQDPSYSIRTPDLASVRDNIERLRSFYKSFNDGVRGIHSTLVAYSEKLSAVDPAKVARDLELAKASRLRHSPEVDGLISKIEALEVKRDSAMAATKTARSALNETMESMLSVYRDAINHHLGRLGAQFIIAPFATNYIGQAPRVNYELELRGKSVKLAGEAQNFANVLSEGDKRCLAFSFFAASVLSDPHLADKIIVIDDPVSSLDRSRRAYTSEVIEGIAKKAKQVIVLGHDAMFLRDLRKRLARSSDITGPIVELQFVREGNGYSNIREADLDRECESEFYQNYRTISNYVIDGTGDLSAVARSIRPLVEGHLHRRFPGQVPDGMMLGKVISRVSGAAHPSPLVHAHGKIGELRAINDFVGGFHHDTDPDRPTVRPDDAEIAAFARRALDLVHGA